MSDRYPVAAPPAFGALVRAWVESAQTHERDFKIEARSIRVALDALHDFVLAEDSNKAAVQGYERRRAAHYGRQEAESSLSPGVVGINFCSAHSKFLFLRTRETFPTIWFLFSSTDSMRGHRGRADGKLQSFNLIYLATEHLWNAGQRSWQHDIVAKIEPTRGGVFARTNAVRVDSRHQKNARNAGFRGDK